MTAGEALHALEELLLSEVRKVDDEIQQLNEPSNMPPSETLRGLRRKRDELHWTRDRLSQLISDFYLNGLLDREL